MIRRVAEWLAAFAMTALALAIAAYGIAYLVVGEPMFPPNLKDSFRARPWGIYSHALFGSIALALGPFQFRRGVLRRWPAVHRALGSVYVAAAFFTGVVGLYMSFHAFGGPIARAGFGALGIAVGSATAIAYARIRGRRVAAHREWMVRSYALIFAAVTLRLELPLLQLLLHGFTPAYVAVAWVSWVPNLIAAEVYVRGTRGAQTELPVIAPRARAPRPAPEAT